jgi:hypothetical protein
MTKPLILIGVALVHHHMVPGFLEALVMVDPTKDPSGPIG